jgi:hypothetical protein
VSNSVGREGRSEHDGLERLGGAIDEVLRRLERARGRAEAAETRSAELEELLRRFSADDAAPGRLLTRLRALETENEDLRGRVARGRESVERLLAQIRFLERQR